MAYITVDLVDLDDDDLIEELEDRGYVVQRDPINTDLMEEMETIVQMHRVGDKRWEQRAIDLLYQTTGKIV